MSRNLKILILVAVIFIGGMLFWRLKSTPPPEEVPLDGNGFPIADGPDNSDDPLTTNGDRPSVVGLNARTDTPAITPDSVTRNGLVRLTTLPVSGYELRGASTTRNLNVRYVERESGHIFERSLIAGTSSRLSNTTIPATFESIFSEDGSRVLFRYVDKNRTVKTYLGLMPTTTSSTSTLSGTYLRDDIDRVTAGSKNTFYYSIRGYPGISIWEKSPLKESEVLRTRAGEWELSYSGSRVYMHTRPHREYLGYTYSFNPSNRATPPNDSGLTFVAGDKFGLTSLVGKTKILSSFLTAEGVLSTEVKTNGKEDGISPGAGTLADKCTWSGLRPHILYCAVPARIPKGELPDDWYKGRVRFEDSLWEIDTLFNTSRVLLDTSEAIPFDTTRLSVSADDSYLVFIEKRTGILYGLMIEPE